MCVDLIAKQTIMYALHLVSLQQFLKDLLKDLCVYNNKGINQGTYELKPEYKRSVGEPETV